MDDEARRLLTDRFVLFSCEGTAEGVVIQRLYDADLLVVPRRHVVKDSVISNRPYTRKRKATCAGLLRTSVHVCLIR